MNKVAVYGLVAVAGIMLAVVAFEKQNPNLDNDLNIQVIDGVKMVNGKIPPRLTDLFPEQEEGPHKKYVNEKSCLKCHQKEMTIPSMGKVPKMSHEFRADCASCHLLSN